MSAECPTCGKVCKNYNGLSTHYARTHPDEWQDRFEYLMPEGDTDECWEWQGVRMGRGYGQFTYDGVRYYAHRLSYWKEYGPIPKPQVNHHCDNPPCVNPNHLYSGTHSDNLKDAYERNPNFKNTIDNIGVPFSGKDDPRTVTLTGEDAPSAKVTNEEAEEIRQKYENGELYADLAEEYGLNQSTIGYIVRGDTFSDV